MSNPLPTAGGYQAFQSGDHIPVIYSKKLLTLFKKVFVTDSITNTGFEGDIISQGASVKILREPEVIVRPFARGTKLVSQYVDPEDITLEIDQGFYTNTEFDKLDLQHSHIDWVNAAADRAAYQLKLTYEKDILSQMVNGAQVGNKTNAADAFTYLGTAADPLVVGHGAGAITPLDLLMRLRRALRRADVPADQMFAAFESGFFAKLHAEASKLIEANTMGLAKSPILAEDYRGTLHNFQLFESENLPAFDDSGVLQPNSISGTTFTVVAGSKYAMATAKTLLESRIMEPYDVRAKQLQAFLVYGRKVVRPDALAVAHVTFQS